MDTNNNDKNDKNNKNDKNDNDEICCFKKITPECNQTNQIMELYKTYFNKSYRLSHNEKTEICHITNKEQYTLEDWELIFKNACKGWIIQNEKVLPSLNNILENYSRFLNDDYNLSNGKDKPQVLEGIDWSKINE